MSSEIAIKVENLSKSYHIYNTPRDRLLQMLMRGRRQYYREFWALKDVSFEVKKGETVGIIGRNGSGKSTLLQMICGTLNPTIGSIHANGRIAAMLELGSGFNPEFSGRENVYMNGTLLGLSQEEIDQRFDDIAVFADIGNFIEQPVKTYSSGMMVRLAFAVAISVDPDILIVDEALAVGDAAFQRKCMRKISDLSENGMTLLFVSHDLETVRKICSEALYLSQGVMLDAGEAKQVCITYERDLFGASKKVAVDSVALNVDGLGLDQVVLDPALLDSNEKIYGDGRAQIIDVVISNKHRAKTNVVQSNAEMIVSYKAKFCDTVPFPVFGMMITNREGVCIFGTNTDSHPVSARYYAKGDEIEINFYLTNNLGPGIYYLTCGIHATEDSGELIYLQRRMDVLIFKCVMQGGLRIGGVANLNPRIQVIEEML